MKKRKKGYFTVEASLIMPIILFFYLLIILTALWFYCRCAISQDNYLLAMRAAQFTAAGEGYGEVIYGERGEFSPQTYVEERLHLKRPYYPFFGTREGGCQITGNRVIVWTRGEERKGRRVEIAKEVNRLDPVQIIREGRKTNA